MATSSRRTLPNEATPPIADSAVAIGAKALWLQLGIASEEAARRAKAAGLTVVMDRCIAETTGEFGVDRSAAQRQAAGSSVPWRRSATVV